MVLGAYTLRKVSMVTLLPCRIFWRGNIVKVFFRENEPMVRKLLELLGNLHVSWVIVPISVGGFPSAEGKIERGVRLWLW